MNCFLTYRAMRKLLCWLVLGGSALIVGCGGGAGNSASTQQPPSGATGQVVLQSIAIKPATASIAPGTTQAFTATGTYSDGSSKDITSAVQWACPGTTIASVSNTSPTQGLVKASQPGSAVVSASMSGITENAVLTIKNVTPTTLVVNPATSTIGWGNPQQFTATATFSDATQQDVTNVTSWSSFPTFITSNAGLAIGQALGTSTVTAFFSPQSATASLTVDLSNLSSISVSPSNATMANNTKLQLAAIGTFVDGSTRDVTSLVTWSSGNAGVANFVSSTPGLITATSAGSTTVTVTAGTLTAVSTVNVTSATLSSISIFPVNASIAQGTKLGLTAIGVFSDSSVQDLTNQLIWSSIGTVYESVTTAGIVTGITQGAAKITASSFSSLGYLQGSTQVNVTAATLNSIALTPASPVITPGNTVSFTAIGTFSDGSTQDITGSVAWSSTPSSVATTKSGSATAQGMGQGLVTAKLGSVKGTAPVTVASPQQISLAISPSTLKIAQQTSVQLSAQGTLNSGAAQDLTSVVNWTSSSPSVATVGWQTGILTGLTPGQSTITATLGSVSVSAQVTVTNATATSITLSPTNSTIKLGSSQQFTATGNFSDGSTEVLSGVVWSSSAPTVAAVNDSGLANSTSQGTTTITATVNGISGSTNLTVQ